MSVGIWQLSPGRPGLMQASRKHFKLNSPHVGDKHNLFIDRSVKGASFGTLRFTMTQENVHVCLQAANGTSSPDECIQHSIILIPLGFLSHVGCLLQAFRSLSYSRSFSQMKLHTACTVGIGCC